MKSKGALTVHEGGRRKIEQSLLDEFARPGVGHLRKIRELGNRLRPKGKLHAVPTRNSAPKQ